MRKLAFWLVLMVASIATAAAQIIIPGPGPGGITIGPQMPAGPGSIYVTSATYGANCGARHGNATGELIENCGGRPYCNYRVDRRVVGDPRPGCAKDFRVSYVCRQGEPEHWAALYPEASGNTLFIDCRR